MVSVKYQNLKSFQKHLESTPAEHLCRYYWVAIADDFERAQILSSILAKCPGQASRFQGGDCELKELMDAMQSMSLLGESVVVVDAADKLSKKEQQALLGAMGGFVLFGAKGKAATLSDFVEKEGVVLDLLDEKPWDKERRLADQMIAKALRSGKKLGHDAAALLLERVGADAAGLNCEMDKLLCYSAEKSAITKDDIAELVAISKTASMWQVAEGMVWERGSAMVADSNAFHMLLSALRGQLQLGLSLACLIEEKRAPQSWGSFLPKTPSRVIEKRSAMAARFGSSYFRKAMSALFEMELASRNSAGNHQALLERFRAKIHG